MIEKLIGYGADMMATIFDGNTALHIVLGKSNMASPSNETPEICKVIIRELVLI